MQRLSKILAYSGVASRRKCEEIIHEERVKVNGSIVTIPQTMVSEKDEITFDGKNISKEKKVYYILNKPKGYHCTNCKTKKKRIVDLFPKEPRVFTVGRLDKNTKGLIFVTNDGHFAERVTHPSYEVEKEYLVITKDDITYDHIDNIMKGAFVEGKIRKPNSVKMISKNRITITIMEGKKHEVRIFVKKVSLHLLELIRIRIGKIKLSPHLKEGTYRTMKPYEVNNFL